MPRLDQIRLPYESAGVARYRNRIALAGQLAGLAGTAWLIWSLSIFPRLQIQPLGSVLASAVLFSVLACVTSAGIVFIIHLAFAAGSVRSGMRQALRSAGTAVWFAPATLLMTQFSPLALPAVLVLIVSATALLHSQWEKAADTTPEAVPGLLGYGEPLLPELRLRDLAAALTASTSVQVAFVAARTGRPFLAGALLCVAASAITAMLLASGLYKPHGTATLPRSAFGLMLTVLLASGLTVTGIATKGEGWSSLNFWHRLRAWWGQGAGSVSGDSAFRLPPPPVRGEGEIRDDSYPGVILSSEEREYTLLIAPPPSWLRASITPHPAERPHVIPFGGQYWMWKEPFTRPPKGSYVRRGSPVALGFFAVDRKALSMHALQRLDNPVSTACCSGIRIDIANADRYPGTVALELILLSTETGDKQSLGTKPIISYPQRTFHAREIAPVLESMEFPMPSASSLAAFDVLQVIFHRSSVRGETSARIAIERFALIPRRA